MSLKTLTYAHFPNTVPSCLSLTAARGSGRVLIAAGVLAAASAPGVVGLGAKTRLDATSVMASRLDQLLEVGGNKIHGAGQNPK